MIVSEAANEVLSLLEQTDQEEYTYQLATKHINQALFEFAEDNEFNFFNVISSYTLSSSSDWDLDGVPDFRVDDIPGRILLTDLLSTTWAGFSYIKRAWISVEDEQTEFLEGDLEELLDAYGDSEGQPKGWAIDGDYVWWRPIAPIGTDYVTRWRWQKMFESVGGNDEPRLLAQAPYAVLYRACQIASVWLLDDEMLWQERNNIALAMDSLNLSKLSNKFESGYENLKVLSI
jgi:hypothetical protein